MMGRFYGVIPAAGMGVRFGDISKRYPKALLPYKNKPIIIDNINDMLEVGAEKVVVVVPDNEDVFKQFHGILEFYHLRDKVKIHKMIDSEHSSYGPATTLEFALSNIPLGVETAMVCLSDVKPPKEAFQFMAEHCKQNKNVISAQPVPDYERWCMVEFDPHNTVERFIDKPHAKPETIWAANGLYSIKVNEYLKEFPNSILGKTGESQFSDVFRAMKTKFLAKNLGTFKDFGTLEDYFKNREVSSSRAFNEVVFNGQTVTKKSKHNPEKLFRERTWMESIPRRLQLMVPRIISHSHDSYTMEAINHPTLRDIFVWMDNDPLKWKEIFSTTFDSLGNLHRAAYTEATNQFWKDVVYKTKMRSSELGDHSQFLQEFESVMIRPIPAPCGIIHGDTCAANIFYDAYNKSIKLIDPRGDMFGDSVYDFAKLYTSFMCMYDVVDTEMYIKSGNTVRLYTTGKRKISEEFLGVFQHWNPSFWNRVKLTAASLFLSMVPLHSHNRTNQLLYLYIYEWMLQNRNVGVGDLIPHGDWVVDLTEVEEKYGKFLDKENHSS